MRSPVKRLSGHPLRLDRLRLFVIGAAALVGAGTATAVTQDSRSTFAAATAEAGPPGGSSADIHEVPRAVSVDEEMIRSVAREHLLEQQMPADLTNLDLIARDVLAGGAPDPADVRQVTAETLLGAGPDGPRDSIAPPPACPPTARACVDVDGKQAWMVDGGLVTYGPVPVTTGRPGHETVRGTHTVIRHVRHDHSIPFDSPMPYSTYFTASGIAFHEGRLDEPSHGCIHLGHHAAAHFFDQLEVGDEVVAF